MIVRFVVTGAPGAGKTTLLRELAARRYPMVPEAATDVIAIKQAEGLDEPSRDPDFTEWICATQRERQAAADQGRPPVTFYDRSPICTLALARFLGHPVAPALAGELDRIALEAVYEREVFLVQPLGWVEPTFARRITYAQSIEFAAVHVATYQELGYRLLDVPVGPVVDRADLVETLLRTSTRYPRLTGWRELDRLPIKPIG